MNVIKELKGNNYTFYYICQDCFKLVDLNDEYDKCYPFELCQKCEDNKGNYNPKKIN